MTELDLYIASKSFHLFLFSTCIPTPGFSARVSLSFFLAANLHFWLSSPPFPGKRNLPYAEGTERLMKSAVVSRIIDFFFFVCWKVVLSKQ